MRWASYALLLGCYQPRTLTAGDSGVVDTAGSDAMPDAFVPGCFADKFDGTSLGSQWTSTAVIGGVITVNGSLSLQVGPNAGDVATITSMSDFAIATAAVQVVAAPTNAGLVTGLVLSDPTNTDRLELVVEGGQLTARTIASGSSSGAPHAMFDPISDAFLRIARDGTTATFETSDDGQSWKLFATGSDSIPATTFPSVSLEAISVGNTGTGSPVTSKFDNLFATCRP